MQHGESELIEQIITVIAKRAGKVNKAVAAAPEGLSGYGGKMGWE